MEQFLREWSYVGIFVGILLTGLGFPMPEELPVVLGGVLVADDKAVWWIMLPVCIVGVIIGDSFLYFIGRIWGPKLIEIPFVKKHILTPDRLKQITENFQQYGIRILLFARLTPGIRAPIFLTAGITHLPLARFILADGIYAIPGVSLLFYLGYLLRESIVNLIRDQAGRVKWIIILVAIVGVAAYFLYRHWRKPVVTGDPHEMPILVDKAAEKIGLESKIIHPPAPIHAPEPKATESKPTEISRPNEPL